MAYDLRKLSINDGMDVYEMLQQIPLDENGFINEVKEKTYEEYRQWLIQCNADAEQEGVVDGWKVPQTTYWLFVNNVPVGMGKIRHFLTDKLLEDGGSIGYSICSSERGKGYGMILLAGLLQECRKLNIEKVLLTIEKNNIPSIKIALANGGMIEKSSDVLHYVWIDCAVHGHKSP